MKKYVYIALGASLLVACTAIKEEPVTIPSSPEEVSFGAYLNRSTTKAGAVGELSTSGLQTAGFGVFGYHTDNALYSQAALPNFMYNTKVSGASWTYSPIKYWPNEYGENASSEAIDRLTFFAYAPYVAVNSSTGALSGAEDPSDASTSHSTGITRLSRATDTGDPMVSYVVSFDPAKTVDLTWGVAKTAFTNSAGTTEGTNSIAANTPYINVARPSAGKTIDFNFQHALAALNVTVNAAVTGEALKPSQTKIYVRSVSFEGFAGEGSLNLNSTVDAGPQWQNYFGNGALSTESVTIYDGLRDGREATSTDANEKPANLNENIIQSTPYGASPKDGVTATAVNLFNSATLTAPVYVIPTGDNLKVTIAYDVETIDDKIMGTYLADGVKHGSVVENKITKAITGIGPLEAGKKYVVALHLGLNSVDFDADITAWEDAGINESDLPFNSFAVTFTQGGTPVTAPMNLWMGGATQTRVANADPGSSGYSIGGFEYSSSNVAVATVNPTTGEVTAVAPGEATITATGVATKASSATIAGSYKVIVNNVFISSEKAIVYKGGTDVTLSVIPVPDATYAWNVSVGDSYLTFEGAANAATVTLKGLNAGTAKVTCSINSVASPDPITVAVAPDANSVGGLFSVSGTKKVYFAKGNLQATYNDGAWVWGFAEHQWDYIGGKSSSGSEPKTGNNNIETGGTLSAPGTVDLFCWVGSSSSFDGVSRFGITKSNTQADYGTAEEDLKADWGTIMGDVWRTPTGGMSGECRYLISTRTVNGGTGSDHSYSQKTVNEKRGIVLYPDDFTGSVYAGSNWGTFELAGCVFLPAAGMRTNYPSPLLNKVGEEGYYWSSTAKGAGSAYMIYFNSSTVSGISETGRATGRSVRLVRDYN